LSGPQPPVTRATLSFDIQAQQFYGSAVIHIRKVHVPVVTNKIELGIANNVIDDHGLGAQAGVVYFADFSSGVFSDYFAQPPFMDYTNGRSFDYTGKDPNKLNGRMNTRQLRRHCVLADRHTRTDRVQKADRLVRELTRGDIPMRQADRGLA
jgi:hypothetical protein